jgi:very-short-patch-repair endonuclease
MRFAETVVAEIGAGNDGIVAEVPGLTTSARARLRRRGVLVPVGRGVDRLRDHPVTWRSRCRAGLAIAGPEAVLGLRTAARLDGFYAYRRSEDVEVLAPRGGDHRGIDCRIIETRWLPPAHRTLVDGLPCTTTARTFFDLCGDPPFRLSVDHPAHYRHMKRVYNDALGRRGLTFTQEAAVLLVMAKRGRAGTQLVRRLLEELGPKYKPTMSDTETLFLELVHTTDLPEPEKQVALSDELGFIGVVDFLWRDARVVVEVDSSWHDGPLDREVDEERDRRLIEAGYVVRRYRYGAIIRRSSRIRRELAALVAGRPTSTAANSALYNRSMIMAMPWPPPTHIVSRP